MIALDTLEFSRKVEATKSEKLSSLSDEELEQYHNYFTEVRSELTHDWMLRHYTDRIELIRGEMAVRRVESLSKNQHGETMELGGRTLTWTKVAAWAAIATVILALVGLAFQLFK